MTSVVQNKWAINRLKNDKARELKHYALENPKHERGEVELTEPVTVQAYADGNLYVSDDAVWNYPSRLWAMLSKLQDWLKTYHYGFWHELQQLESQDAEAARQARIAKILGAIGNNLDELPELEDEIKNLAQMLEEGKDIRSYCRNYGEPNS